MVPLESDDDPFDILDCAGLYRTVSSATLVLPEGTYRASQPCP